MNRFRVECKHVNAGWIGILCRSLSRILLFIIIPYVVTGVDTRLYSFEKNAIYYSKKGGDYLSKGDNYRAILNFRNALKLNPNYHEAIIGLGNAYRNTEAYEESLKLYNNALRIDRNDFNAMIGIGSCLVALGRYSDAIKYYNHALELSEGNVEAQYGIANLYFLMDKMIWAKRGLKEILRINPYHYKSLLLMADIKNYDNRIDEARGYAQKAIDSNNELPEGYVKYGQILMSYYQKSHNNDYLNEAIDKFNMALSIHPEDINANRCMGYLSLIQEDYSGAIDYFKKSLLKFPDNNISLYNLAIAYDKSERLQDSLKSFVKALGLAPSNNILRSRLEDFLTFRDFKIGHPLRVRLSNEHYEMALDRQKKNLTNDALMHFRRSLYLNPMNRISRESLRNYYLIQNLYRFHVDQHKDLLRIYQEDKYQQMLEVAIIKRRSRLYHRVGYSDVPPPRDVPIVLVMNFWPRTIVTAHFDAGVVLANYFTFAMNQFGRMQMIGINNRMEICRGMAVGERFMGDNLEKLAEMVERGKIDRLDYIVYGNFNEGFNFITATLKIIDFHKGVVISDFSISEGGKESLSKISLRASKRIFDIMPFKGRVLKINDEKIIINLGLFDGIKPGDFLTIERFESPKAKERLGIKRRMTLVVDECDTLISSAKLLRASDIQLVDLNNMVYPLKKRRARLIE